MIQKNQEFEVDILDLGYEGEGIAKIDGYTTFVKGALKGEKAKIKILKANKEYGFAKLISILKNSTRRETPSCSSFGKCGGCNLQHMEYEAQLDYKTNKVKATLKKELGYEVNIEEVIGMGTPYNYRNKVQYPISQGKMGFYANRTHALIENEKCYLQNETIDTLAKSVFDIIKKYNISTYDEKTGKGCLRHIMARIGVNTGELMLVLVTNEKEVKGIQEVVKDVVAKFPNIKTIVQNINMQRNNVILGDECKTLYGDGYITDIFGEYKFKISPLSFYQVNPVQTEVLYNIAKEYAGLTGQEIVYDLYCGIGTISTFVADKKKKVIGVEIVEDAIKDAKENAKLNEKNNIEFIVRKSRRNCAKKI